MRMIIHAIRIKRRMGNKYYSPNYGNFLGIWRETKERPVKVCYGPVLVF